MYTTAENKEQHILFKAPSIVKGFCYDFDSLLESHRETRDTPQNLNKEQNDKADSQEVSVISVTV